MTWDPRLGLGEGQQRAFQHDADDRGEEIIVLQMIRGYV